MKLLVDSGSTKADWISIDETGKILFTTQTLGLNPEVLNKEEIISRVNDRFDISFNKETGSATCSITSPNTTASNASEMADAIEKLVRDAQLRKIMGEAGKARANQYFSLDRMLKDHTDLYRSL
jgi:glycosyltransferase involved in cell wall biosynthesis